MEFVDSDASVTYGLVPEPGRGSAGRDGSSGVSGRGRSETHIWACLNFRFRAKAGRLAHRIGFPKPVVPRRRTLWLRTPAGILPFFQYRGILVVQLSNSISSAGVNRREAGRVARERIQTTEAMSRTLSARNSKLYKSITCNDYSAEHCQLKAQSLHVAQESQVRRRLVNALALELDETSRRRS